MMICTRISTVSASRASSRSDVPFDEIRRNMDVDVGRACENVLVRTARVHNPLLDCQPLYFP